MKTRKYSYLALLLTTATGVLAPPSVGAADPLAEEKLKLAEESRSFALPEPIRLGDVFREQREQLRARKGGPLSAEDERRLMAELNRKFHELDQSRVRKPLEPEYDLSTLGQGAPVLDYERICQGPADADVVTPDGDRIRMLTYAVVFNERGKGAAMFGHVMQRFDYCRNGRAVSLIFNEGPLAIEKVAENMSYQYSYLGLTLEKALQAPAQPTKKPLFSWIVTDIAGEYRSRQTVEKRSVYEAHLEMPGVRKYLALLINMRRFVQQGEDYLAGRPLRGYGPIDSSCLLGFTDTINRLIPMYSDAAIQILPTRLYAYTAQRYTERLIMYPKPEAARKLGLIR